MGKLTLLERRLRIVTGLILAVYILTHLFNHSLGLLSLEAMETMRKTRDAVLAKLVWRPFDLRLAVNPLRHGISVAVPTQKFAHATLGTGSTATRSVDYTVTFRPCSRHLGVTRINGLRPQLRFCLECNFE